jgi:hypothetical protein
VPGLPSSSTRELTLLLLAPCLWMLVQLLLVLAKKLSSTTTDTTSVCKLNNFLFTIKGNSQQSKVGVPANWVPLTVADAETQFKDVETLEGLSVGENLVVPVIVKGDFYTFQLTDIAVTFNGVNYKGTLIILYDDYNGAYYESSAPFRAEFSWRYEGTSGGTQMSYNPDTCIKMMNLLVAITESTTWFNDSPSSAGSYVY